MYGEGDLLIFTFHFSRYISHSYAIMPPMVQKYKIFVSANQKELRDERLAIKNVVSSSETIRGFFDVFLFEDLPAKGKSPVTTYLKYVDESDIYVCIIGMEYGIKGKDGLSATEREYRRFLKRKPEGEIIAFVKAL